MIQVYQKYNLAQLVELIGTEKQREQIVKKGKLQSKSKQALLKELETIVKYQETKEGRKVYYLITEVFDTKKEKIDRRSENGKQMEIVELEMLKYLARRPEKEQIPNTKTFLSQYVGLCNEDFKYFRPNKENKDIESVWYSETKSEIRNRLNSALRSLQNKGLINVKTNMLAIKLKDDKYYTIPSIRQECIVLNAEKKVMDLLNIKDKRKIYFDYKLNKEFYEKVIEKLEKEDIVSYYYGIDIIQASDYYIEKEINILDEKLKVNSKFIELYQIKIENADNGDLFGDKTVFRRKDYKYTDRYKEKAKELNNEYIKLKIK